MELSSGRLQWRWGDLIEWAPDNRSRSQTDLRGTALGDWMHEHGWSVPKLAKHLCVGTNTVYRLLGHDNPSTARWNGRLPGPDVLDLVSLETGIGIGELVEDVVRKKRERRNGRLDVARAKERCDA